MTIRRSNCENRAVKSCDISSKSIKLGQTSKLVPGPLNLIKLGRLGGFKWVLGIGQCFKVFWVFKLLLV